MIQLVSGTGANRTGLSRMGQTVLCERSVSCTYKVLYSVF